MKKNAGLPGCGLNGSNLGFGSGWLKLVDSGLKH